MPRSSFLPCSDHIHFCEIERVRSSEDRRFDADEQAGACVGISEVDVPSLWIDSP